jgi:hypothetical protein
MSKSNRGGDKLREHEVEIIYEKLGTIHPNEQLQAILEDFNILADQCGSFCITGARLILPVTNEWGDPIILRKETGQRLRRFDTNHYVPACKKYEL